jgi:hypothetical protein
MTLRKGQKLICYLSLSLTHSEDLIKARREIFYMPDWEFDKVLNMTDKEIEEMTNGGF